MPVVGLLSGWPTDSALRDGWPAVRTFTAGVGSRRRATLTLVDRRCPRLALNERFNGTVRREILNAEWFTSTRQAQVVINCWLKQYVPRTERYAPLSFPEFPLHSPDGSLSPAHQLGTRKTCRWEIATGYRRTLTTIFRTS
ncbi:integrase core domain-containing protein [Aliiruegeria lutimaris]|uniref:integrase core domain-containing protein n=1 Tax=Aliiruegeria lutimaris TaxID=571298 RepID=UPI000B83DF11